MSALLFLSALFTLFSPLPIMLAHVRGKARFIFSAFLVNFLWVVVAAGWVSGGFYLCLIGSIGIAFPRYLLAGRSAESSIGFTFAWILGTLFIFGVVYFFATGQQPWVTVQEQVAVMVDQLISTNQIQGPMSGGLPPEQVKQNLLKELPSAAAIFCLLSLWVNMTLFIRLGAPETVKRVSFRVDEFKRWKSPEWFIWPAILSGATLLYDFGWASVVGVNVFKFMMAIYALQGLAILSFFFDHFRLRGIFRSVLVLVIVFFMMPLLLGIGFFDLWFDFRAKLGQSKDT